MQALLNFFSKSDSFRRDFDQHMIRAAMVFTFYISGTRSGSTSTRLVSSHHPGELIDICRQDSRQLALDRAHLTILRARAADNSR